MSRKTVAMQLPRAGIVVTNAPDVFIEEVADHAMMLLLAAARRARQMHAFAASGQWFDGRPLLKRFPHLLGQTLGLVSFGNVARCTAKRAKAFGLRTIAYDPCVSELTIGEQSVEPVSFAELLERSDCISIHSALNEETRHLLNAAAFARMKDGVAIVNTARDAIAKEDDLIAALEAGKVGAAGLDVLEQGPPADDNPLFGMDNVIITPHVASATAKMRPPASAPPRASGCNAADGEKRQPVRAVTRPAAAPCRNGGRRAQRAAAARAKLAPLRVDFQLDVLKSQELADDGIHGLVQRFFRAKQHRAPFRRRQPSAFPVRKHALGNAARHSAFAFDV